MDGANLHADLEGHWAIELALVEALGSGGCGEREARTRRHASGPRNRSCTSAPIASAARRQRIDDIGSREVLADIQEWQVAALASA